MPKAVQGIAWDNFAFLTQLQKPTNLAPLKPFWKENKEMEVYHAFPRQGGAHTHPLSFYFSNSLR